MSRAAGAGSYWSGYDLLWGLAESGPTRRTAIDRAQIVAAAIDIADRSGLTAVTMRAVAASLDTAPMSLYRHVPDKEALVALMVDAAIAGSRPDVPPEELGEGWKEQLRMVADSTWRLCRLHRWFPEASTMRPPITPSGIEGFEFALSFFDPYDLDIGTKAQFVGTVYSTVVACAMNAVLEEDARSELSEEEAFAEGRPIVEQVLRSGRYPRVSAFIVLAEHLDATAQMRTAVELILDGIEGRLRALSGAALTD